MKRFILLTFGFLGWAFYEMSGGADFEPKNAQMAASTATENEPKQVVVADEPAPADPIQIKKVTKTTPVDTTPPGFDDTAKADETRRVSLNLTTEAAKKVPVTYVPVNPGNTTASDDTPAIIPSLIVPNDPGIAQVPVGGNIREVTGSSVNVRGGPGTDYGIVTKLGRGDTVEIIQDNGDGWVRMRPLDGGPEGWMADFLLTSG